MTDDRIADIRSAILEDRLGDIADLPVPDDLPGPGGAAPTRSRCSAIMPIKEKDPRKSLHLQDVPTPELGPGEAIVAVMASAINYNTVWTSIFEPVSTFGFLKRYGASSSLAAKHDLPYHVVGSDLAGVVLRVGPGVTKWKAGDEVVAHCLSVELEDPQGHDDTMMDPQQRIWGFETNFGGLAELALVKSNQLMPKPAHLTWEEAAAPGLVNSTAYRQLVSHHGAGDEAGRHGARLGRLGRPRRLRHAVRPQRRRHPDLRRLVPREGRDLPVDGRGAHHRPQRRGLRVLEGRRAAAVGVEAARQEDPRAHRRRRRRHRLRAPGTGDLRRLGLRHQARRHDRHVRVDDRATCTSTTTATSG